VQKRLIACLSASLLTTCLVGCGQKSNSAQYSEKLEALLDDMSRLKYADAPASGNKRVYTAGTEIQGVLIPGEFTADAAYIDQTLALLPQAKDIAANGNTKQKEAANTLIASILADEGAYLIGVSEQAFQEGSVQLTSLRSTLGMLQDIRLANDTLSGDAEDVIQTIQTGAVGDGTQIDGIDQRELQIAQADKQIAQAKATLEDLNAKITALKEKTAEYEAIELKLSSDARGSLAAVKYEKLDKATTAALEAETAQAEAEALVLNVEIAEGSLDLAQSSKQDSEDVIAELKAKIAAIKEERRQVSNTLAQLDQARQKALSAMTSAFDRIDAYTRIAGLDRMAAAVERFEGAAEAFAQSGVGFSGQLQEMSIYTLHARVLHQQAISARNYKAILKSLAAAGPEVIGQQLHQTLTTRISEMESLEQTVSAAVKELNEKANAAVSALQGSTPDTPEGAIAVEQLKLFQSLISSAG